MSDEGSDNGKNNENDSIGYKEHEDELGESTVANTLQLVVILLNNAIIICQYQPPLLSFAE